jgi:hypothetical protein
MVASAPTVPFSVSIGDDPTAVDPANKKFKVSPTYFRQFRLEITYEQHQPPSKIRASTSVKPRRSQPTLMWRISGSDSNDGYGLSPSASLVGPGQDYFVNSVYSFATSDSEIGHTFGVVLNSGSLNPNNSALIYRLTGALADQLGSAPSWLLNNQFGMPSIPQSSASLAPYVSIPLTDPGLASDIITPQKTLDGARRLSDVASDVNPALSLWQLADAFSSGTAT